MNTARLGTLSMLAGCATTGPAPDGDGPTWHQDVAPIVMGHCGGCHAADGIGPFSVETYDDARRWAGPIEVEVSAGRMPPWGQEDTATCASTTPFRDDPRLTEAEKRTILDWVATGAAEGDPATAAPLPSPRPVGLDGATGFADSPTDYDAPATGDDFRCFLLDPQVTEDVFLTGVQVVPGDPAVVHHALAWIDEDGSAAALAGPDGSWPCFGATGAEDGTMIHAWAPGGLPMEPPSNVGIPMAAGSKIVMQIHYHGAGPGHVDRTGLDLRWTTETPEFVSITALLGNAGSEGEGLLPGENDPGPPTFVVPAGVQGHTETMETPLPASYPPLPIWAIAHHMHLLGTNMRTSVRRGDGTEECLLETPKYDYSWQRWYAWDTPISQLPHVYGGDTIVLSCTYDNSMANERLEGALAELGMDAPIDVHLGEGTLEEMCIGVFGVILTPEQAGR